MSGTRVGAALERKEKKEREKEELEGETQLGGPVLCRRLARSSKSVTNS